MQFESGQMYRVRAVAEALDVSVATIYRAVESGSLRALKLGTGKGALRITGEAVNAYIRTCAGEGAQADRPERASSVARVETNEGVAR